MKLKNKIQIINYFLQINQKLLLKIILIYKINNKIKIYYLNKYLKKIKIYSIIIKKINKL
jgi:hypothetical protein